MNVFSKKSLLTRGLLIFGLLIPFLFFGCSLEDLTQDKTTKEIKDPLSSEEIKPQTSIDQVDLKSFEKTLNHQLSELSGNLKNGIDERTKNNYERIKSLMDASVIKMSVKNAKFQFLCDENERWIYRCNLITGEIECFSMSSNKLRLLSSIK
ncbi:MAG TPA: hypothetical protein DCW45_02525 [Opitutae bacterium]|nr:hypothetical protein [Opitutae bacterium]